MTAKKKTPLTAREFRRRIRSGEIRIEVAPRNSVEALGPYVDRVVTAIEELFEISGLLVTDESCICDCVPIEFGDRQERTRALDAAYAQLGRKLGIELDRANDNEHHIVQIAYKLKQRDRRNTA